MIDKRKLALKEAARLNSEYGVNTGLVGSEEFPLNVIPTGILALDYALGVGGYLRGQTYHVYGPPDVGKSSVIGFSGIREAQKMGLLCGIIALEPNFSKEWAVKNGVDPETVVVARPDTGEDAFEILREWVTDDIIDFMVFDSIGAVVPEGQRRPEAKVRVGGASALITEGVKNAIMPCFKNNKVILYLNQVRDNMDAPIAGLYKPPGGNALLHDTSVNIELKRRGKGYTAKIYDEDVEIGRELVAILQRNKLAEGSKQRAFFDYWLMETDEHEVGVDRTSDILNTAMRAGVIRKDGSNYSHALFPENKSSERKIFGKPGVGRFFEEHPKAVEIIRNEVLTAMTKEQIKLKNTKPELKVVHEET